MPVTPATTAPENAPRRVGPEVVLVAPRLRTAAWWVVAGLSLLVAIGGVIVHGDRSPLGVEIRVQAAVDNNAGNPETWNHVFGTLIPRVGLALFVALVMWTLIHRWWRGALACAAVPLSILITGDVLKPLVDRKVSESPALFYPSGHLTGVGALATLVLILVLPRLPGAGLRVLLVAISAIACGAGLLATVASHAHGPLDALAGLTTGAAVTLAWVLLLDMSLDRAARRPHQESTA